jgi:hypothetical protein
MSEEPTDQPASADGCAAQGRRRAANIPGSRGCQPRRGPNCSPQRPSITRGDGRDDRAIFDTASELEGFASWFADWWLRRGRDLTAAASDDQ